MKHIVSFSGGVGSYMAAKRVVEEFGAENTILLFTDTLMEDWDLYRFMVEAIKDIYGDCEQYEWILEKAQSLEFVDPFKRPLIWRTTLSDLSSVVMVNYPNFIWLSQEKNVWDVFFEQKLMGNTRYGNCTKTLKQTISRAWLENNYGPDECINYIGIDWSEKHRYENAIKHWLPYTIKAPMCDEPYMFKDEMLAVLEEKGIEIPRLYKMGFSHNNCGGFCVKAGHGHFKLLLETMPERFAYHEAKEREFRETFNKNVSVLKRDKIIGYKVDEETGKRKPIRKSEPVTFQELREAVESEKALNACGLKTDKKDQLGFDFDDFGGCGCYPY